MEKRKGKSKVNKAMLTTITISTSTSYKDEKQQKSPIEKLNNRRT